MRQARPAQRWHRPEADALRHPLRDRPGGHPVGAEDLRRGAGWLSVRLSPDGMYFWDGAQWVSTISHDGRSRWDGQRWVPLQGVAYAPAAGHRTSRRPTSWTRPLQYVIAAYYALAGLYAVTLPFTMGGVVTQVVNQSIQHQQ